MRRLCISKVSLLFLPDGVFLLRVMGKLDPSSRARSTVRRVAVYVLLLMVSGTTGCRTTTYRAKHLPIEYSAPPVIRADGVDLSRFSGPAVRSDVIHQGDQLEVTIATGIEEESPPVWSLRVTQHGAVNVPIVGSVMIAGATLLEAERVIRRASIERGKFVAPNVVVRLKQRHSNRVIVLGAVKSQGTYDLPATGSDLLTALLAAEGLADNASTTVEIWNPTSSQNTSIFSPPSNTSETQQASFEQGTQMLPGDRQQIDLAGESAEMRGGYQLRDGSVVKVVPAPPRRIKVIGLVKRPDQFDIPMDQELRLLGALALAGGRTLQIADRVRIIRQVPETDQLITIGASVREAKSNEKANLRLAPGDVVSVEETAVTFTVETLRSFVRFGFSSAIPGV